MLIDTHVLYWWVEFPGKLSTKAVQIFEEADNGSRNIALCSVSFWELEMKVKRGLLQTTRPLSDWVNLMTKLRWMEIVNTSASVWLKSADLEWEHRDPADRIIAVTAFEWGFPLLSKDRIFHEPSSPVEAVW